MTNQDQRYALVSLSDKDQIETIAKALVASDIKLISTGGTLKALVDLGFDVQSVEDFTDFPEIMDGRVKTLHPNIHGALLADRTKSDHLSALSQFDMPNIEFVVVNLYPFTQVISKVQTSLEEAIENIDIGGPTMVRAAAKNYQTQTIITDKADYDLVAKELEDTGHTSLKTRLYLAQKAFQLTSYYDTQIMTYLASQSSEDQANPWPYLTQAYSLKQTLRYGENSQQEAKFYQELQPSKGSIAGASQLHGKELSYNNIKDADVAIKMAKTYQEPTAVAIKHMNPCGVGVGSTIEEAFDRCYQADSVSIFGGILSFNRQVTKDLAEKISKLFIEIVIAPDFSDEALDLLSQKKNIRLLEVDLTDQADKSFEQVSVEGGLLVQETDDTNELDASQAKSWEVYGKDLDDQDIQAIQFLMTTGKFVKSNAIVVGNQQMTLGVGAGQMNRVTAAKLALDAMTEKDFDWDGPLVLASDAFIPMRDTVDLASKYGVDLIVQPGGSIRDSQVIEACQEHGINLVMTGNRHFKH